MTDFIINHKWMQFYYLHYFLNKMIVLHNAIEEGPTWGPWNLPNLKTIYDQTT